MPPMADEKRKAKRYPSRDRVKYIPVPTDWWQALADFGSEDDRSAAYMGRKAIREFLERAGRLPKPPKDSKKND